MLLDENIGCSTAEAIRHRGHDVSWVVEDSSGAADAAIIAKAESEGRVLVTSEFRVHIPRPAD